MEQSPRLSLSYIAPAQSQKHVTANETFRRLDALVQLTVRSRTTSAQPGAPDEGDGYVLPASPTGADWENFAPHNLAFYQDSAWVYVTSVEGLRAYIADEGVIAVFDGAAWVPLEGQEEASQFGVNTAADATNRLSVKSDAVLFSHDDVTPGSGDAQIKINKDAAADTASHLFQTAFSGRAELGLTGDDDFHVKVSADGSAWNEAVVIDKDTGHVGLNGEAAPAAPLHILNDSSKIARFESAQSNGFIEFASPNAASGSRNFAFNVFGGTGPRIEFQARTDAFGFDRNIMKYYHDGSVEVGVPTGGARGAGTLNAEAVYDDNTLLTCYVFDQEIDGSINTDKWDAKVPDRIEVIEAEGDAPGEIRNTPRIHLPLRRFAARIGTEHDPLTLDGYARHWKERRHLTALPNEASYDPLTGLSSGEWIQRLVETVEVQAILIEQLNQRTKSILGSL